MGYIYTISNVVNGFRHSLVGQTTRLAEIRWKEHRRLLRRGKHCNPHLQYAWNKYGEDAFSFYAYPTPDDALDFMEEAYRRFWGYYNIREGGFGGKLSEITRRKISDAAKGRTSPNKGKRLSVEHRHALSEANKGKIGYWKGKKMPKSACLKMSKAKKGKIPINIDLLHTEEVYRKISESMRRHYVKSTSCT